MRLRKAKRFLSFLRFIPYLRAAAVSGSLALLASGNESDIDLLILTKKNRIWLARLFLSLYFQVVGQRRHGRRVAARFCLNHYLVEDTAITEDQNLYTAVEYASLIPVIGCAALSSFWEKNTWLRSYLQEPVYETGNTFFAFRFSRLQKFAESILDWTIAPALNHLSGLYQKRRIKRQEHILVSDTELSFHPGSRGQKVLAALTARFF